MNPTQFGILVGIAGVLLTALTALIVAVVRKPVTVTDLWAENRSLRNDMDAMDKKFTVYLKAISTRQQIVGEGFLALSDTVEEAKVQLIFTPDRQKRIQAAREALADDLVWPTLGAT